ncbi:GxxExxY protein [Sorangium sp. KYC3313]|uniref:GxxExxY protein n=1 Tax=Sorangium sp. KYC3313 TaxID=3449740 RepID=UPI003F8BADC2
MGERVIVECKSTAIYNRLFEAQALTCLRLCDLKLALVINFGERLVRQGIRDGARSRVERAPRPALERR